MPSVWSAVTPVSTACGVAALDASTSVIALSVLPLSPPAVVGANPSPVIAGLDPAIHPTERNVFSMDARVVSAFTRVFRRAMPGHDESRTIAAGLSHCSLRAAICGAAVRTTRSGWRRAGTESWRWRWPRPRRDSRRRWRAGSRASPSDAWRWRTAAREHPDELEIGEGEQHRERHHHGDDGSQQRVGDVAKHLPRRRAVDGCGLVERGGHG